MTSALRTDFTAFVLELLDFMEEKTCEAIDDDARGRRRPARPPSPSRCCPID
jgi:hypothetical protein